jgi:hypothetical protein
MGLAVYANAALLLTCMGTIARAEDRCISADDRAVVMLDVRSQESEEQQYGAGIIFASQGDSVFIVTARHVVQGKAPKITVTFKLENESTYEAAVAGISPSSDVAFISVRNGGLAENVGRTMLWQLLPSKVGTPSAEYATVIGNNGGELWTKSEPPEKIVARRNADFKIVSHFTRPGSSGGGVFDPNEELIGMVSSDQPGGQTLALSIDGMLQEARKFNLPVNLTKNPGAVPAVQVAPPRGAPGDWGRELASAIRQKLGRIRRIVECENDRAISMRGTVEVRSPTMTTDVISLSWQFSGGRDVAPAQVSQFIEINRLPWKHASDDPAMLSGKTDEAADFAVAGIMKYLAQ